jgi:WD40 repeat protein
MRGARQPPLALCVFGILVTAGCKTGTIMNPPSAAIPARLYVANAANSADSSPGSLMVFALPFSSNVAPLVTVAPPAANEGPFGLALDGSHRLWVGYQNKTIAVYKLPLTHASTPQFSISTPAGVAGTLAFDGSGNLMAGIGNSVYVFPAPLSSGSTSSFSFLLPNGAGCCVQQFAVHGSTLAVATFIGVSDHIYVYSLPLTAASTPTASITTGGSQGYSGVAFDASGNLYAAGGNPQQIEIYAPPFTNASTPTTIISTAALAYDQNLAFDSSGNLYYTTSEHSGLPSGLYEYSPPFTAASTPSAQTTIGFGALVIGVAAGN